VYPFLDQSVYFEELREKRTFFANNVWYTDGNEFKTLTTLSNISNSKKTSNRG